MTRAEAIKIIEMAKAEAEWEKSLEYQIAFEMAIEALNGNDGANQTVVRMNQYGGECTQIGSVKNLTIGNFSGKGGWVD